MIKEKSLGIYKNKAALVVECAEKLTILLADGEKLKVREKDIELLHQGPLQSLSALETETPAGDVQGAWELLEGSTVPLAELAELAYGEWTPRSAWAAWELVRDGLYFSGSASSAAARSAEEVAAEKAKRDGKAREAGEREAFLERLRQRTIRLPEDGRQIQDVEALAYGKTDKSRTLKDIGRSETPQEAHKLLLSLGFWTNAVNPHPSRFGLSTISARIEVAPPPEEERRDLRSLPAFAVDNAWSSDPDDAVYLDGRTLYVHVADPAAAVVPGSPADLEARERGATLYLPEGSFRMIREDALEHYALGLSDSSPALTFKLTLGEDGSVEETEIFRSTVAVSRLTYEEADARSEEESLAGLFAMAERNIRRRAAAGAVAIDLPEVHISAADGHVSIDPIKDYRSAAMVRECMLLAGEGTAKWAIRHRVPFPFVAQEAGDLPASSLEGLAGSYQLRRCMRPRRLSSQPGPHAGLGLAEYTQVTSPLRRYTDLLAHQQIRAVLSGSEPLSAEEVLARVAAAEASALACVQAERASKQHWTMAFLAERPKSVWKAVILDRKGAKATLVIPELALETQTILKGDEGPNDELSLQLQAVRVPELEAVFALAEE